jgi:hypothetical protein
VSCVGSKINKLHLRNIVPEKFEIVYHNENISVAEVPIINHMQILSKQDDFLIWYIHTKGVFSALHNPNVTSWRKMMEHFVIIKHNKCIEAINSPKCDMCGSLVYDAYEAPASCTAKAGHFFAGNFFWSKASFIRKTPNVMNQFDGRNRWLAEFVFSRIKWARFYSFYQKPINNVSQLYSEAIRLEHYMHIIKPSPIPYARPMLKLL